MATRDMPLAYADCIVRGLPGTTVDLMVLRHRAEPQNDSARPAWSAAVQTKMLANDVGYVRAELASGKVKEELRAYGTRRAPNDSCSICVNAQPARPKT